MNVPKQIDVPAGSVVVHIVDDRLRPLCEFSNDPPKHWPHPHYFVRAANPDAAKMVTCGSCALKNGMVKR